MTLKIDNHKTTENKITLEAIKREILSRDGWALRYTSKRDGKILSYYFVKLNIESGVEKNIRVSDHQLGSVNGEEQGMWIDANIVLLPNGHIDSNEGPNIDDVVKGVDHWFCHGCCEEDDFT